MLSLKEENDVIHPEDRDSIKLAIVDLMLKSPPSVQKQLSTAIAIIGKEDFPAKWPNLIHDMVIKVYTFIAVQVNLSIFITKSVIKTI